MKIDNELWLHINSLPYFRAIFRSIESSFFQELDLQGPILDFGSGDGHFASVTFRNQLELGIDQSRRSLRESQILNPYQDLVQSEGGSIPVKSNHFGSVISNCVLEHIPDIDKVLAELNRVSRPGAVFAFGVPTDRYTENLVGTSFLNKIKAKWLSKKYGDLFNRISRHVNLDNRKVWIKRLEEAGFEVLDYWNYLSPQTLKLVEIGHIIGIPSLITKKLFGKWILVPRNWNLFLTYKLVYPHFKLPKKTEAGVCTFFISRKI